MKNSSPEPRRSLGSPLSEDWWNSEPYNFKGDLDDFPLTVDYGKKVDAFRSLYSDYLWNWKGEFRDSIGAKVHTASSPHVWAGRSDV